MFNLSTYNSDFTKRGENDNWIANTCQYIRWSQWGLTKQLPCDPSNHVQQLKMWPADDPFPEQWLITQLLWISLVCDHCNSALWKTREKLRSTMWLTCSCNFNTLSTVIVGCVGLPSHPPLDGQLVLEQVALQPPVSKTPSAFLLSFRQHLRERTCPFFTAV